MAHVVERPRVFNDEDGDPLRLIVMDKKGAADDQRYGIDNKKSNIESLLVARNFFVVGDVAKPFMHIINNSVFPIPPRVLSIAALLVPEYFQPGHTMSSSL